jgi:phospholipid/cholesterol/gamma-HCH transport system substrate-binding protein
MKLSNETKVGLLAVVAIVLLVVGFNFLKGSNIFSRPPVLYAKFADIGSLDKSNPVRINGLQVGTVYNLTQSDKEVDSIVVEIHLTRDILIPKNSVAYIDASILGSAYINIEKGDARAYYSEGDTVSTRLEGGIIANIQTQMAPTITRINQTLDSLRVAIGAIAAVFDPGTKNNMQNLIANLTISSAHLQRLLNSQTGALAQSLDNLNSVTANLAKNNDAISSSLHNVELTTSKLANANIDGTIAALQGAVSELKTTISNLNSKNGSLGLLMNDRELYDRLNRVAEQMRAVALSAEITLDDLRLNPKRYLNFSLIGGKDKGEPLTSPAAKDTLRVRNK